MDYRSQIQEKIADFNDGLEEDTMVFTTKIRNMISIIEGHIDTIGNILTEYGSDEGKIIGKQLSSAPQPPLYAPTHPIRGALVNLWGLAREREEGERCGQDLINRIQEEMTVINYSLVGMDVVLRDANDAEIQDANDYIAELGADDDSAYDSDCGGRVKRTRVKRKPVKRKPVKRKSVKRKSVKRKSVKRTRVKRRSVKRKSKRVKRRRVK
jgi:hypothetical protein